VPGNPEEDKISTRHAWFRNLGLRDLPLDADLRQRFGIEIGSLAGRVYVGALVKFY